MKEKIQNFMEQTFLFEFNSDITEDCDLFKLGVIDSYGYIQLIKYLESEFNIKFSEEEILSNVFVTFSGILGCISKKVQDKSA